MRGKIIQCKRKLYISMLRFSKLRSQRFCMYVTGELRVIEKAGIEDKKTSGHPNKVHSTNLNNLRFLQQFLHGRKAIRISFSLR